MNSGHDALTPHVRSPRVGFGKSNPEVSVSDSGSSVEVWFKGRVEYTTLVLSTVCTGPRGGGTGRHNRPEKEPRTGDHEDGEDGGTGGGFGVGSLPGP